MPKARQYKMSRFLNCYLGNRVSNQSPHSKGSSDTMEKPSTSVADVNLEIEESNGVMEEPSTSNVDISLNAEGSSDIVEKPSTSYVDISLNAEESSDSMEKHVTSNTEKILKAEVESSDIIEKPFTSNVDIRLQSENSYNDLKNCSCTPAINIILNHDFSGGLHSWHPNCCNAYVISEQTDYPGGLSPTLCGHFAVVTNRTQAWQGLEQDITDRVSVGSTYSVCAWVRISGAPNGVYDVLATLKLEYQYSSVDYLFIGRTSVSMERWEKVEGTFSLSTMPSRVVFYLEGPPPGIDLLIRSVVVSCRSSSQHDDSCCMPATNIILNHDFSGGLQSWHPNCCDAYVVSEQTGYPGGLSPTLHGHFAVVTNRKQHWQGLEQDVTDRVSVGSTYSVCAWVRISGAPQGVYDVLATLKLEYQCSSVDYLFVGRTSVSMECWEKVEGTFSLSTMPCRVVFYLEGPPPGIDLLIRSVVVSCSSSCQHDNSSCIPDTNIILNHDFSGGLHLWHPNCCNAYVISEETDCPKVLPPMSSGRIAVITNRKQHWQGLEQDITDRVSAGSTYSVCAWVGISGAPQGVSDVQATLKLEYEDSSIGHVLIGRTSASMEHWEKVEGTFCLSTMPKRAIFYLEGPSPGIDLLIRYVVVSCRSSSQRDSQRMGSFYDDYENIIQNPRFDDGLNNWSGRGCQIVLHDSMADGKVLPMSGKSFGSTAGRTQNWNGIQQEIMGRVRRKLAYEVIAVVRIFGNNITNADVKATLWIQAADLREQYISIATAQATDKDWVQLQGKFLVNGSPSRAVIFLEGPPPGTDILIDNLVVRHAAKVPPAPPPVIENAAFGVNIISNSNLRDGTNGWFPLGNCNLGVGNGSPHILPPMARDSVGAQEPLSGRCILVTNRSETWMGPAQMITDKLKLYLTYQVSAWVRIGDQATRPQNINVALGVDGQWVNGGQVEANDDEWHEIGGSFRIEKQPSKVMVYVQGPEAGVDLMVAGLQIFPVDRHLRFRQLKAQTDKIRKRDVILKFTSSDSSTLVGASVKVRQTLNSFPFGSCISRSNMENEDILDFFRKNFNWAVFENELKWYWTEPQQGNFNYKDADELLNLCTSYSIELRGHCIFWEVEEAVQPWIRSLNKNDMISAVQNRLTGLLTRYKGKFKHYDVNNEMLHGSFYQDHLGKDIRANMFKIANQMDPSATLFVNDYNIEDGCDAKSSPEKYIQQILDLQEQGAPVGGIGIQGHINSPVGPIVCSALDKLGILGLPIWFTEVDVSSDNEYVRADDLEVMLREVFAHPAVDGVMLWGFWELMMSRNNAHLVNAEGDVNEAGKRYLGLKQEWLSHAHGHVNEGGQFGFRGFHGSYEVELVSLSQQKVVKTFVVNQGEDPLVMSIDL